MKRTLAVLGAVGVCSLLALDARAKVTIVNASTRVLKSAPGARGPAAESTSRERWVGTKAIVRDAKTGKVRKPTDAETRELVRTIRRLTARPAGAARPLLSANGSAQGIVDAGYTQVVLVRATEDGENETLCVSSFEEATNFLGLVPAGSNQ